MSYGLRVRQSLGKTVFVCEVKHFIQKDRRKVVYFHSFVSFFSTIVFVSFECIIFALM